MIEKPQTYNGDLANLPAALAPLCQQYAVEVDPVHGGDLVENARQLAPSTGTFELQAMLRLVEVVDDGFENAE
jgi:hypothetical protein